MAIQRRKSARMVRRSNTVAVVTDSGATRRTDNETVALVNPGSNEESMGKKWLALMTTRLGRSTDEMVRRWFELFSIDPEAAFCKLLQYFLHFSGFLFEVESAHYMQKDVQQVWQQVSQPRDESNFAYPLQASGKNKEVAQFELFIDTFVKQLHDKIIGSNLYIDRWFVWLLEAARCPIRSIRHSATFVCLKWSSALNGLLRNYQQSKSLLESNRKTALNAISNDSNSQESTSSIDRQLIGLDRQIQITVKSCNTFDQIFEDNLLDTEVMIRMLCVKAFSFYIANFPEVYLDDRFLSKVALLRLDPVAKVQVAFLQVVEMLLKLPNQNELIQTFVWNIFEDLLIFAQDSESKLCIASINVLNLTYRIYPHFFTEEQLYHLYVGVYALDLDIAKATGEFLLGYLSKDLDRARTTLSTVSGKKVSANISILYNLVKFYQASPFEEKGKFLANGLVMVHPVMTDWQSYIDLLNEVVPTFELLLEDQTDLAALMVHFVKRCAKLPKDKKSKVRINFSKAEKQFQQLTIDKITSVFIVQLVPLLRKYRGCELVICKLVKIAQYFSYQSLTQFTVELNDLLVEINYIIEIHHDQPTLKSCFKVYRTLLTNEGTFKISATTMFELMIENLRSIFVRDWNLSHQLSKVQYTAFKLSICSVFYNLSPYLIWDQVFAHLLNNEQYVLQDEQFCQVLVSGCRSYLLWELRFYQGIPDHDLSNVKRQIYELIDFSRVLMASEDSFKMRRLGFLNACDMLVFFSHQIVKSRGCIRQLHYAPDEITLSRMYSFMNEDIVNEVTVLLQNADEAERFVELKRYLFGFAKLIFFGILSLETCAYVLQHYSLVRYTFEITLIIMSTNDFFKF
jgi:hypothetical protein